MGKRKEQIWQTNTSGPIESKIESETTEKKKRKTNQFYKHASITIPGREEEIQQPKEALAVFGVKHIRFQQRVEARVEFGILEIVLLHEQKETVERQQTDHTACVPVHKTCNDQNKEERLSERREISVNEPKVHTTRIQTIQYVKIQYK